MTLSTTNPKVFIVAAKRTPLGSFNGSLASFSATQLGSIAIKETLASINLPAESIDQVYFGCVLSSNLGQNPARQAALGANIPISTPVPQFYLIRDYNQNIDH